MRTAAEALDRIVALALVDKPLRSVGRARAAHLVGEALDETREDVSRDASRARGGAGQSPALREVPRPDAFVAAVRPPPPRTCPRPRSPSGYRLSGDFKFRR